MSSDAIVLGVLAGKAQCLVQLATNPVAVCHGSGSSKQLARADSALAALQYLRTITRSRSG